MSQIPKAFQGCDLTGWTVQRHGFGIVRFTVNGDVVQISERFECEGTFDVNFTRQSGIKNALIAAEDIAESYGGWAPAPIGSDPGWKPIETAPRSGRIIGFRESDGFIGDCYSVAPGEFYRSSREPIRLTHWRPLPAPPEAKP